MKDVTTPSRLPQEVPLSALLGSSEPPGIDWGEIRALQYDAIQEHSLLRIIAAFVTGAMTIRIGYGSINSILLFSWMAALVSLHIHAYARFRKFEILKRRTITRRETGMIHFTAGTGGLLWAIIFCIFSWHGDSNIMVPLWATMLCLMVGSAMLYSAIPLSSIMFISSQSMALVFGWFYVGNVLLAFASVVVAILLISACLLYGRSFVDRRIAEASLEASLNEKSEVVSLLLKEFEEAGADWLWQTDSTRHIVHASPRFVHALGLQLSDVEGKSFLQLMAGDAWEGGRFPTELHELADRLRRRESFSDMVVPVRIGNKLHWWELSASPKLDEKGVFQGFRGVGSDVTQERETAEKIARLARFDTLTGLPNRLQLTEAMAAALEAPDQWNRRCGFMMIDLDRFKSVNDTLGHPVGDRLLAHVSGRLSSIMSDNELCGRLGGDEFAIVVKEVRDTHYMEMLGQKIIDALSLPYEVDQHTLYVGASIGTAIGPRDGQTVEMLMRSADLALYRSKDQGGGRHNQYEPRLHVNAEERRVMEIALRNALENGELSLNYQPVVSAATANIVGFEALLRWNNPQFGAVSPTKFIPLAEDARLIVAIGEWVMRAACKEAMYWPPEIKLAVNASVDQLTDPGFLAMVISALQQSGLPASRLEIEVTESIFVREASRAAEVLNQIIALGINLSLDDFGTGYSALGYLRKTRFSTIKVDRSFVVGAAKNAPESLAIIRAVVAMAESLGMSTTAEGAETDAEVKIIQSLGCRRIQGFYFGRPMDNLSARALFDKGVWAAQ